MHTPTLAVDFDGVVVEGLPRHPEDYKLWTDKKTGTTSKELLLKIKEIFPQARMILHSCRWSVDLLPDSWWRQQAEAFLFQEALYPNIITEIWKGKGKPIADFYLDDKAVLINSLESWLNFISFLEKTKPI